MKLEGSNVFRGYAVQRLINKVSELSSVVSVSVDGPLGHVADFKILSESNGQQARSSIVRRHEGLSRVGLDGIQSRIELRGFTPVKLQMTVGANDLIVLIIKRSKECNVRIVATGWELRTVCSLRVSSPRQRSKERQKDSRRSRSKTFE